ncbi:MAG: hypothetical protein COB07_04195 [Sulfurovum sp.]|nr:MAG: hypothetical protein COB07_04195 [Sulfurovum sp.]
MTPQEQEIKMMRGEITKEMRAVFKVNMKVFDWDIPENDDRRSAELILRVMQDALDNLKTEISNGKYDNY